MLILTRKKGETIQIGSDIEITVTAIQGEQVKLGITAPKHVEIHRKEVWLDIQAENTNASADVKNLFGLIENMKKQ